MRLLRGVIRVGPGVPGGKANLGAHRQRCANHQQGEHCSLLFVLQCEQGGQGSGGMAGLGILPTPRHQSRVHSGRSKESAGQHTINWHVGAQQFVAGATALTGSGLNSNVRFSEELSGEILERSHKKGSRGIRHAIALHGNLRTNLISRLLRD